MLGVVILVDLDSPLLHGLHLADLSNPVVSCDKSNTGSGATVLFNVTTCVTHVSAHPLETDSRINIHRFDLRTMNVL